MKDNLLKNGSSSLLIGKTHYNGYFPYKINKLLKVTRITNSHNEFTYLDNIRSIENYKEYYTIPDEEVYIIQPTDNFYKYLKLTIENELNIFNGDLYCFYIDYAGSIDVLDSIDYLSLNQDNSIWDSSKSIVNFSKQIMKGLSYLHNKKLCHLDIKPENIMIDVSCKKFKIIDFGFCCKYPFDNFVNHPRGTPGYMPKRIELDEPGLPIILANDMILVNGETPMKKNRKLVYKIDSYCLGRVINFINYYFLENVQPGCMCFDYYSKQKLNKIIKLLLTNNVYTRPTVTQVLNELF